MSEYFRKPVVKTLMLKGQEGQSIKGIEKTGTSGSVDTYTITLTDGTTSTFEVENGTGISSISKTGTSGLVDAYTIRFNDGTASTFTVTNGESVPSGGTTGQFLKKKSNTDYDYVWETLYPVGSIYMSTVSTSPASLFAGTWEQLKDRFLLAAGNTYAAGSTGGEAQHKLILAEMPRHRHSSDSYQNGYPSNLSGEGKYCTWVNTGRYDNNGPTTDENGYVRTSQVGGSSPHNNMPPYLAVYTWKRVA